MVDIEGLEDGATLADAHEIRRRVFVDEQGVPESLEMDDRDAESTHLVAYEDGPVGTARIREIEPGVAKVERVAVLASARGRGIGKRLMRRAEERARDAGADRVVVHAQLRVEEFYEKLGYERTSGVYEEADIPHVTMEKSLSS